MKPKNFQDAFFTRSMHQHFNNAVGPAAEEPPLRHYLRHTGQL